MAYTARPEASPSDRSDDTHFRVRRDRVYKTGRVTLRHHGRLLHIGLGNELALMADPLLAKSAIDRLQSAAHELVLDGESYRCRQKPGISQTTYTLDPAPPAPRTSRRRR